MADSEKIRILLDQGLSAYGLGNVDEAREAWQTVLAMDPGNTKAQEYLRFVKENWGPGQERETGLGDPYRPDEGSGEIPTPEAQDEDSGEIDISVDVPVENLGEFEKDAFTPPAKPILAGEQWGDLYDFGKSRPTDVEEKKPPEPPPKEEPASALTPAQEQIAPLAGDWSNVLTREEQEARQEAQPEINPQTRPVIDSSSTLPPHPGDVEAIEIVEELQELEPIQAPEAQAPQVPTSDTMTRDELTPTKKYDSVPTMVRPPEEADLAEAVPPAPQAPPVEPVSLARDSFDRFPVDPEPLEPEPGVGFFQTPRPEMTPPLGSPILQPEGADLLDLVDGGGGTPAEAAAVPGITAVSEIDSLLKGAKDMLELDDFSGAMELLDKVLEQEPGHSQGQKMRGEAEQELLSMLSSKLGDMDRTPRGRMSQDEIIWLNLDNRAGFVLSLVDGSLSLDEIISICGLPQLEGMRILVQLLQEKVIEIN